MLVKVDLINGLFVDDVVICVEFGKFILFYL